VLQIEPGAAGHLVSERESRFQRRRGGRRYRCGAEAAARHLVQEREGGSLEAAVVEKRRHPGVGDCRAAPLLPVLGCLVAHTMDAEHRMSVRHSLIPLALALFAAGCADTTGPNGHTMLRVHRDRKSTRLNSSHVSTSY